jgi:murein DD-endopeptidase MepM/ murein hydrolase activator NlpD
MKKRRPSVTIVIHRDGELESRTLRFPAWLLRFAGISGAVFLGLVVLGAVSYAPVGRIAAQVPGLRREIDRLSAENEQVRQLAQTLSELEATYSQVRSMLGANIVRAAEVGDGELALAVSMYARTPGAPPRYESGPSVPSHWPMDSTLFRGVVTRGQVVAGSEGEAHPGVDIAVTRGTPIRSAGGGSVAQAGNDPEYGLFVLVDHPDGYQTMYGHASRLLVAAGDQIDAGQVIALSGSTGRSTAPHLHFEMRRGGLSIDPIPALLGKET